MTRRRLIGKIVSTKGIYSSELQYGSILKLGSFFKFISKHNFVNCWLPFKNVNSVNTEGFLHFYKCYVSKGFKFNHNTTQITHSIYPPPFFNQIDLHHPYRQTCFAERHSPVLLKIPRVRLSVPDVTGRSSSSWWRSPSLVPRPITLIKDIAYLQLCTNCAPLWPQSDEDLLMNSPLLLCAQINAQKITWENKLLLFLSFWSLIYHLFEMRNQLHPRYLHPQLMKRSLEIVALVACFAGVYFSHLRHGCIITLVLKKCSPGDQSAVYQTWCSKIK